MSISQSMAPEEIYLKNLRTIERIAAFGTRRNHLNADEAAEFTQEVRGRLIDDDCEILRKFEGRSQLTTYLTTVILRLCQQYRVQQGKWRPSAEVRRLGDKASTLESADDDHAIETRAGEDAESASKSEIGTILCRANEDIPPEEIRHFRPSHRLGREDVNDRKARFG